MVERIITAKNDDGDRAIDNMETLHDLVTRLTVSENYVVTEKDRHSSRGPFGSTREGCAGVGGRVDGTGGNDGRQGALGPERSHRKIQGKFVPVRNGENGNNVVAAIWNSRWCGSFPDMGSVLHLCSVNSTRRSWGKSNAKHEKQEVSPYSVTLK